MWKLPFTRSRKWKFQRESWGGLEGWERPTSRFCPRSGMGSGGMGRRSMQSSPRIPPHAFFTPFPAAGLGHCSRSNASRAFLGPKSSGKVSVVEARYLGRIFRAFGWKHIWREWEGGKDCTALDIQKSSSNILNSDNIPTHGDCAERLEALLRLALELVLFLTGLYFRLASWSCLSGSWAFVAFRE